MAAVSLFGNTNMVAVTSCENALHYKEPRKLYHHFPLCLRRRRSKPSVYSVCELVHNIVFECRRVARTDVVVFDWLISYTVCD